MARSGGGVLIEEIWRCLFVKCLIYESLKVTDRDSVVIGLILALEKIWPNAGMQDSNTGGPR